MRKLLLIMQRLDRGRMVCTLNGLKPGDEIELSREHVVTTFATTHTIPSLGYVVWDRRNKLKEEYHGLPGDKIRDLRQSGVAVTQEMRTPLLAYTGDTSPAGLDAARRRFEAKVLITELSFIRPNHRREKIHKFGHMHLDDLLDCAERFKNELIICAHFSTRYHPQEVRATSTPSCRWGCGNASNCGCECQASPQREQGMSLAGAAGSSASSANRPRLTVEATDEEPAWLRRIIDGKLAIVPDASAQIHQPVRIPKAAVNERMPVLTELVGDGRKAIQQMIDEAEQILPLQTMLPDGARRCQEGFLTFQFTEVLRQVHTFPASERSP